MGRRLLAGGPLFPECVLCTEVWLGLAADLEPAGSWGVFRILLKEILLHRIDKVRITCQQFWVLCLEH